MAEYEDEMIEDGVRWRKTTETIEYKTRGTYDLDFWVSEDGRVKSPERLVSYTRDDGTYIEYTRKERLLKQYAINVGYMKCTAGLVHRLVAKVFCDNPDDEGHVHHKDNNKLNNHYTNLRWVSSATNIREYYNSFDCIRDKRCVPTKVFDKNDNLVGIFIKRIEIAEYLKCTPGAISAYFYQDNQKTVKGHTLELVQNTDELIKQIEAGELQKQKHKGYTNLNNRKVDTVTKKQKEN